ncbi:MAG: NAD(P)H-dependent glycerol-3-phosphate dehydrogenase [Halanaerobiales bacterium]
MNTKISIIGGGSWGTALAQVASTNMEEVLIYARDKEVVDNINKNSINPKYFNEFQLNNNIKATHDIYEAVRFSKYNIISVPTSATRTVMKDIEETLDKSHIIISSAKGLEISSFQTNSEIIREFFDGEIAVLSGPTHAEEVIKEIPTAIVVGSKNIDLAKNIQEKMMTSRFRIYTIKDVKGIEIAGAVKNIIAVASGVTDGVGYGDNTKAALITRGLAEIVKFGLYMNTNRETYHGLAGLGDLVVTCYSNHSRNRRFGIQIGKGKSFQEAKEIVRQVVEGAKTAKAVYNFLQDHDDLEMPITEEVYKVLYQNKEPHQALDDLMLREPRNEFYYLS